MNDVPANVAYDGVTLKINVIARMPCGKKFEVILNKNGNSAEFEGYIHHDISSFTPLSTTVGP